VPEQTTPLLYPRSYPRRLSLVIPMFNEEACVPALRAALESFMSQMQCQVEAVLVNDGSTDATVCRLAEWAGQDTRIKVIHLSRNFGHQLASTAGLEFATGDAVVLLDADLQDPLETIHAMIARYQEGYDVVYGQRTSRPGDTSFKRFSAWAFYRLMRRFVHPDLPLDSGDFRLMSRECLDALGSLRETHRFLRGMVTWVGFPQIAVPYQRHARAAGKTKYPLRKMIAFAWTAASSFSTLPLRFSLVMGILFGLFGIEEAVRAILAHLLHWYTVPGWTSSIVTTSILGSALLISMSIVGEYVGKIYEQVKNRPLYLVARTINVEPAEKAAGRGQN
jgi:dolichol-phosphate mannosyltransferase